MINNKKIKNLNKYLKALNTHEETMFIFQFNKNKEAGNARRYK